MSKKAFVDELKDAFAEKGCAFCRLTDESANKYIEAILWEMVTDPETRIELRKARGYCPEHTHLLVRPGSALGTAILMKDVINVLQKEVAASKLWENPDSNIGSIGSSLNPKKSKSKTAVLHSSLSPQSECPVCKNIEQLEKHLIKTLIKNINQLAESYRQSAGLCLPHLKTLLAQAPSNQNTHTLLAAQLHIWEKLDADLTEFIRKNDYRFRHEGFGLEKDAWKRGVEATAGILPQNKKNKKGLTQ